EICSVPRLRCSDVRPRPTLWPVVSYFSEIIRLAPRPPFIPYTTLFRSPRPITTTARHRRAVVVNGRVVMVALGPNVDERTPVVGCLKRISVRCKSSAHIRFESVGPCTSRVAKTRKIPRQIKSLCRCRQAVNGQDPGQN